MSAPRTHPVRHRAERTCAKSPAQLRNSTSPDRATPPTKRPAAPPSVRDSEPLPLKTRFFDFIHHGYREILSRNVALALVVHQQLVGPSAILSGPRTRLD